MRLSVPRTAGLAALLTAAPASLLAHRGGAPAPHDLWSAWILDPVLIGGLAVLGAGYVTGLLRVWRASRTGGGISRGRAAAFGAGFLALVVALVSPLDPLGEALLTAHMIQHLLLLVVAAPLLTSGLPAIAGIWSLPAGRRQAAGRWWKRSRFIRPSLEFFLRPSVAWLVATGTVITWHLPVLYEAALASPAVHAAEHLCFLASGAGFWWVVLQPSGHRRLGFGAAIPYVVSAGLVHAVLGALLTLSTAPWYPTQSTAAALWGLSPLGDQQLAGIVMWVPGGLVHLCAAAMLFLRWLGPERRPTRKEPSMTARPAIHRAVPVLLAAVLAGSMAGCGNDEPVRTIPGGDVATGREQLVDHGCGACHMIPGIGLATGTVGPSLEAFSRRAYIAGLLPNTPDNIVRWIVMPQSILPGGAMPNLGVTDRQARNMAAYLYTLQ